MTNRYRRALAAGDVLFRQGDIGDSAFFIESGTLEVVDDSGDTPRRIARLQAGDIVGEMALIDGLPRTASVIAESEACLQQITPSYLESCLEAANPLLRVLLRTLLERYRGGAGGVPDKDRAVVLQRVELENAVALALERREFELFLQPIVHLGSMQPVGFEALIRWRQTDGQFMPPGVFIPIVEESPLVHDLGQWVFEAACNAAAALGTVAQAQARPAPFVAFNLSPRQLAVDDLSTRFEQTLQRLALPPQALKIEITETGVMEQPQRAIEVLERCRALGLPIAIDDFGTGYSSLSHVHRLPADTLKIDRSFIARLLEEPGAERIVEAVVLLARGLSMDVVAEGLETLEQARHVHRLGVEFGQGFLFSPAVPLDQACAMLQQAWPWDFDRRSSRLPRPRLTAPAG